MMNQRYQSGCLDGSKVHDKTAVWLVHFYDGLVSSSHRYHNACVRAVRASEYQVSLFELHNAWKKARAGKKPSANQLDFDARWIDGLIGLQDEINSGNWAPKPSSCFIATKPKTREIHAPDFSDRIVHHWLIPQLESIWEPKFIHDSYANRKGKGSHAAVNRLKTFVREVQSGQGGGYFLQLDIYNFFNSIYRPALWEILKKQLIKSGASNQVLSVAHALIRKPPLSAGVTYHATQKERDSLPDHKKLENAASGCGLPIGNLSSQFFANVYLDRLDQFVKHTLKAKRYLRYVDDFVLVHKDKQQLEQWKHQIERFIAKELRLKLKADIRLRPLSDGIDFLGYIVRPTHTLVRRRVVSSARTALSNWEAKYVSKNQIFATPADLSLIKSVLASYDGHFKHAQSEALKTSIKKRFSWISTATRKRKFDYRVDQNIFTFTFN